MQKSLAVGALLTVLLLAGAAVWMLAGGSAAPIGSGPEATPNAVPPTPARGDAATPPATGPAPERTAVPPPERRPSATAALVGKVVDDQGLAVAGAVVQGYAGLGGLGGAGFDPAAMAEGFDPERLLERLRTGLRDRVEVTTDALGRFRLVPPGEAEQVFVRVEARGHQRLDRSAARPQQGDVDLGTLALVRGAVVVGRVLDAQGAPVAGARVVRRNPTEAGFGMGFELQFPGQDLLEQVRDGDGGLTDQSGRFELAHVEPGEFVLQARHVDHPPATSDKLTVAKGQLRTDVVVTMAAGATITGTVVDVPAGALQLRVQASRTNTPTAPDDPRAGLLELMADARELLAGAGLPLAEQTAEVAADHTFTLRGLHADGRYKVAVVQAGRGVLGDAVCSEVQEVAAGSRDLQLHYDAGIIVTCQVVETGTGRPLERLWVRHRLQGGSGGMPDLAAFLPGQDQGNARTCPEGRITIPGLRPKPKQTLQLTVEALGHTTLVRDGIELPAGGQLDLGTLSLDPAPVLTVVVRSADGNRPLADADVRLRSNRERGNDPAGPFAAFTGGRGQRGPRAARTDAQGRCQLNARTGATTTLTVAAKDHAPYQAEVAMPETGDRIHEAVLVRGGTVQVTVLDGNGQPQAKADVEHQPPNGGGGVQATDAAGQTTFAHLAVGTHRFRLATARSGLDRMIGGRGGRRGNATATPPDGAADAGWQQVEIADGQLAPLEFRKAAVARLTGLLRENGAPLAGARIAFVAGPGNGNEDESPEQQMAAAFEQLAGGRGAGNARNGRSGDDGSYRFDELPAGAHRLRITHRNRMMPTVVPISLALGDNRFDFDLDTTVLRGLVKDPQGQPVANATVTVRRQKAGAGSELDAAMEMAQGAMPGFDPAAMGGGRSSVKTGDDGTFELRGLQAGVPLVVSATAKGFARSSAAAVTLAAGGSQDRVEVTLLAAGKIKVTAAAAGMFGGVQARLLGPDGQPDPAVPPVVQMLRRGNATLDGLRPGRWRVSMAGMGRGQGPGQGQGQGGDDGKVVEVVAGQTTAVEL